MSDADKDPKKDLAGAALQDFIAGTIGGMIGMAAGYPMDTVKTRQQAMPRFDGAGTLTVLRETARQEGAAALYRGMATPLYSAAGLNAIIFCVQGTIERIMEESFGKDHVRLNGFLAGCVAGLVQSPLVSVTDLMKTQRQVMYAQKGSAANLLGPVELMQQRVKTLGFRLGTMQGLGATVIKECPSYGAYFLVYEESSAICKQRFGWHAVPSTLLAGGLAGCIALGMVHPVDVVKSRIQALPVHATAAERSVIQACKRGFAEEGVAFFLRGFGASMQRAFILNAATFGGYELAKSFLIPE